MKMDMRAAVVLSTILFRSALAQGDAAAGKIAFGNQCAVCHTVAVGKNGFGPSLAQVIGRHSGALKDYNYSSAMSNAGLIWQADTLDVFLTSSTDKVPGTSMQVAIADNAVRKNVIAYLETLGTAADGKSGSASKTQLSGGPTDAAYNLVPKDNTACNTPYVSVSALPSTADCGGVGIVRHYVGGFLWKFYKGRLGYIHGGPEIEYITNTTYTARNGTIGRTNDTMFYLTIRYFPFQ